LSGDMIEEHVKFDQGEWKWMHPNVGASYKVRTEAFERNALQVVL
jgi:hypothetical protein